MPICWHLKHLNILKRGSKSKHFKDFAATKSLNRAKSKNSTIAIKLYCTAITFFKCNNGVVWAKLFTSCSIVTMISLRNGQWGSANQEFEISSNKCFNSPTGWKQTIKSLNIMSCFLSLMERSRMGGFSFTPKRVISKVDTIIRLHHSGRSIVKC